MGVLSYIWKKIRPCRQLHIVKVTQEVQLKRGMEYHAICRVIIDNKIETLKILLQCAEDLKFFELAEEQSFLDLAAKLNRVEIVKMLLDMESRVIFRVQALTDAVKELRNDMVKLLLSYSRVDKFTVKMLSKPFEVACQIGNLEASVILFQNGAKVNPAGRRMSPLHVACFCYNKHKNLDLVKFLLRNKAAVDKVDFTGTTPLIYALHSPEVMNLLIKFGAQVNPKKNPLLSPYLGSIRSLKILLKHKVDLGVRTSDGHSVYHLTAFHGRYKILEYLLRTQATIDLNKCVDVYGNSPMHILEQRLSNNCKNCKLMNLMLHYGYDISVKNNIGQTASFPSCKNRAKNEFCSRIDYFDKVFLLSYEINDENFEILSRENYQRDDVKALDKYGQEIFKLMTIFICNKPRVSLYDFLLSGRQKLTKFSKNENLVKIMKGNLKESFPNFGLLLSTRVAKATKRKELVDLATDKFWELTGLGLSEICSEKIFSYKSNEGLKNFIEGS